MHQQNWWSSSTTFDAGGAKDDDANSFGGELRLWRWWLCDVDGFRWIQYLFQHTLGDVTMLMLRIDVLNEDQLDKMTIIRHAKYKNHSLKNRLLGTLWNWPYLQRNMKKKLKKWPRLLDREALLGCFDSE